MRDTDRFYEILGKNIRKYRELRNLTLEDVGERIHKKVTGEPGATKKTIQRYETAEIKIDMIRLGEIAEVLDVSVVKLLKGTGTYIEEESNSPDIISIPLLGFVPAGGPVMSDENLEGYIHMSKILARDDRFFCLRVRGDSMQDVGINDGDIILVRSQPTAENGQTVIARIDGEVTCKRLYRMDGTCRLEPANRNYKPIDCDNIEIVGIVKRVIKEIY